MKPLSNYASLHHLPELAGLCSFAEAAQPGLLIEECVRRLKRFHYCLKRMHELFAARITSEPIYELKMAFAHHAYLCAEHATAIRTRVSEMREPPLGLDAVPHPALEAYFDEIRNAPTTEEFIYAIYLDNASSFLDAIEKYQADTNPLTDAPSRRTLKFARLEIEEIFQFGMKAFEALGSPGTHKNWFQEIMGPLEVAFGDWDGTKPTSNAPFARRYSEKPYVYDPVPKRDQRFQDLWNQGVNAESFLYSSEYPARAKVLMMLYKRMREIDVPEMMASIIHETTGKPWEYYRAMTRQMWDEARHAMMGEVGFVALGVDWTQARITFNWSYRLNTECSALERHGVLFFIEQGLMPKTGKRYEYEVASESGFPLAATLQDFDWADEVLHSQIGRAWFVTQFENLQKALEYGDAAWSRVLSNWSTVRDQGLTQHENWWPGIYTQACTAEGVEPDGKVSAFSETYEGQRADRKGIVGE